MSDRAWLEEWFDHAQSHGDTFALAFLQRARPPLGVGLVPDEATAYFRRSRGLCKKAAPWLAGADADDHHGDVLAKMEHVYRRYDFEKSPTFSNWYFTVALYHALDHYPPSKRDESGTSTYSLQTYDGGPPANDDGADAEKTSERVDLLMSCAERFAARLSPRQSQVLYATMVYSDSSDALIGVILGLTAHQVRNARQQALIALRELEEFAELELELKR